jgi:hypothetical protein
MPELLTQTARSCENGQARLLSFDLETAMQNPQTIDVSVLQTILIGLLEADGRDTRVAATLLAISAAAIGQSSLQNPSRRD